MEKTQLNFGFIPLTDCAPLVVAKEGGFFAQQGLEVTLSREPSWANIRDKVLFGQLDGAQMLASMPLATTLGINGIAKPTITAFNLDLNGNAITVSNALYQRLLAADPVAMQTYPVSAQALKKVIDADKAAGKECMTFAVVFPVSTHNYALRYWMAAAGIHPDKDVRLVVVPPPKMVMQLQARRGGRSGRGRARRGWPRWRSRARTAGPSRRVYRDGAGGAGRNPRGSRRRRGRSGPRQRRRTSGDAAKRPTTGGWA